ncbi:2-amino-4-hydroxy-6-hydroxymethyldihydropteridine diphosphokinase [Corynebacterium sp. HS2168-gen11]|uniref:2-amino-4-hydroxy-6- hydroxymethyldihydropteridine diphosphokinase n=1 Tax=Corynebacterium sp. HS2168-gen11 TaxID=2974027 RepID=UPI00216AB7AA|nr:2-amino-4-hydroxy-6-hydroxymethyldihydropteridine diphosphokinase [Corynebacterium sp. HS2168-gen11]MCS4536108.1 2-amino-4-hydroxy-6-hydroxymethyldihydropteridine diphosphokinase [Corynebacterium sp. HS2168-gen11]
MNDQRRIAVLSLGSNLDDRRSYLELALAEFREEIVAQSQVYSTPAWGITEQPDFYNVTIIISTTSQPYELLARAQQVEQLANRRRDIKWGPRTLDVDIIAIYENGCEYTSDDPVLTLPHPFAHQRAFVLLPWAEIDPDATIAGQPITQLIAALPESERDGIKQQK